MDGIADTVGSAIGRALDEPVVGVAVRLVAAYVIFVWLAAALWAFVDTRRRSRSLVAAYASAAMTILASPLLFPFAILLHTVLRPSVLRADARLSDVRSQALEAEALVPRCPDCRRPIEEDWLVCPACRRTLGHRCQACDGTVKPEWPVCAWCGEDLDGAPPPARNPRPRPRERVQV